jgi:hypothetical protein
VLLRPNWSTPVRDRERIINHPALPNRDMSSLLMMPYHSISDVRTQFARRIVLAIAKERLDFSLCTGITIDTM